MDKNIKFEDAQQLKKQHPDTFYAPDETLLDGIAPGDFVKVCTSGERFWVEVIAIQDKTIAGRIDNQLLMAELSYNEIISFSADNVYDILDGPGKTNKQQVPKKKPGRLNSRKRPGL